MLGLLADGLTYQQIAERLCLSTKTVDHHVTAVRRALGATTRGDAVTAARRRGVLAEDGDLATQHREVDPRTIGAAGA